MIVVKKDGAFNYDTTDLAALRYRIEILKADRVLYVVDARQSDHFKMLFAAARLAGWLDQTRAIHIGFGTVMGSDGKPFKTREGGTVKLADLLDEAERRAGQLLTQKFQERGVTMAPDEQARLAQIIGIGALKYADLMNEHGRNYLFSWERMLAFDGNTAPYLQYAAVRIASIFRKRGDGASPETAVAPERLQEPTEQALLRALAAFPGTVADAASQYRPDLICQYLFGLAQTFSSFYNNVPVLKAEEAVLRATRLELCRFTAQVLNTGLGLLGIEVPERM